MSILKRGKNYQIDYYCKGKRYRELIGPSKKEAEAVLGKRLNEIREGKFFGKVKLREILVEDLVRDYLERFQGKKVVDEKRYMRILLESFAGKFVSDIDRRDVESLQAVRRATLCKDGLPRANSTCNREVEALRRLLNKAIEWGMLERNPASRLKRLPEPQGRTRFLSLDEAKRLLEASSRHLRPIIVSALETGMRRGEILNLRWSDVDMKTHTIYLGKTKNGESRYVPISHRLFSVSRASLDAWGATTSSPESRRSGRRGIPSTTSARPSRTPAAGQGSRGSGFTISGTLQPLIWPWLEYRSGRSVRSWGTRPLR